MQWRFGRFRLDQEQVCLWDGDHCLPLRPKTCELLVYLVTHAGELVRKETLLEAVWPDTAVTEGVLTTSLGELRKVLGETAKQPQYIATVPRRGYRFLAPVTPVAPTEAETYQRVPPQATPPWSVHASLDAPGPQPILVDRETELTQLQQWWQWACQGHRQVVFVTGEAGMGKTALVDAFLSRLATPPALQIGRGQCLDHYGAGEAYLPLLEALGQLGHGAQSAQVIAVLRQHAPSWLLQLPALWVTEELPELQHRALGGTQERMLRELAEAVEALTHAWPLVLVLEDLHWSDSSTLDWVGYIARRRAPARLLVLGTYRPVDAVVREHPIRSVTQELRVHGQCVELLLPYVSEAGVAAYLEQRCGAAALPELVRTLHRRTHGNPLFFVTVVEEIWRQGRFHEQETGREGQAHSAATILEDIPESLRQIIERQLEQLPPEDRTCLEVASVAGREFSTAAVAAGMPAPVEAIEARLAALARRGQFVHACGSETWPDRTMAARYGFTHDLYHELLYEQIVVSARRRYHQQIGRRLEAAYGLRAREAAAELAEHFVRGREYAKAVQYHHYAGENALRRSAPQEAIKHLRSGLAILPYLPGTPERDRCELDLQLTLAPALMATQGFAAPELEQAYTRARELCTTLGAAPQLFAASYGLYVAYFYRTAFQQASELCQEILGVAEHHRDRTLLIGAHEMRSCALYHLGQFVDALTHMEAGLGLYTTEAHTALVTLYGLDLGILCRSWAALTLCVLGYADRGRRRNDEALALARSAAHPFSLTYALLLAAQMHCVCREVQRVRECTETLMALAAEYSFVDCLVQGQMLHGWACALQGQEQAGITEIQQGMAGYRAAGSAMNRPSYLALLAEAYGIQGQAEAGLAVVAEALDLVGAMPGYVFTAWLYQLQGELLLMARRARPPVTQTPEACFQQALTMARRQQARALELRAALRLSRLWQQQGKRQSARRVLAEIYGWFTEGFDTADLQEARALLEELA